MAKIMEWYFCTTETEKFWTSGKQENNYSNKKLSNPLACSDQSDGLQQYVFLTEIFP